MNTHAIEAIHSPDADVPGSTARRPRPEARRPAARAAEVAGAAGARILRRWSVADLIARAGGAPRAFA